MEWAPADSVLRMLVCLRILMRDSAYQKRFFELGGVKQMSEYFTKATNSYLIYGDGLCMVDILKEMTSELHFRSEIRSFIAGYWKKDRLNIFESFLCHLHSVCDCFNTVCIQWLIFCIFTHTYPCGKASYVCRWNFHCMTLTFKLKTSRTV